MVDLKQRVDDLSMLSKVYCRLYSDPKSSFYLDDTIRSLAHQVLLELQVYNKDLQNLKKAKRQ